MSTMAHNIGRYLRQFRAELKASCVTCRQPLEGRVSNRVTWWCTCYHCGFSINPKWTFDYYHPEVTGPEVEFFDPNDDGTFAASVNSDGPTWKFSGDYVIMLNYGDLKGTYTFSLFVPTSEPELIDEVVDVVDKSRLAVAVNVAPLFAG